MAGLPETKCFPQTLSLFKTSLVLVSPWLTAEIHRSLLSRVSFSYSSPWFGITAGNTKCSHAIAIVSFRATANINTVNTRIEIMEDILLQLFYLCKHHFIWYCPWHLSFWYAGFRQVLFIRLKQCWNRGYVWIIHCGCVSFICDCRCVWNLWFHQVLRCSRVVWSQFWTSSKFLLALEITTNN